MGSDIIVDFVDCCSRYGVEKTMAMFVYHDSAQKHSNLIFKSRFDIVIEEILLILKEENETKDIECAKFIAYSAIQYLPNSFSYNVVSGNNKQHREEQSSLSFWNFITNRVHTEACSEENASFAMYALNTMKRLPLSCFENLIKSNDIESNWRAILSHKNSCVRQLAAEVLGEKLLLLWVTVCIRWKERCNSNEGHLFENSETIQKAKDRIIETWRHLANLCMDNDDSVSGTAFKMVQTLVEPSCPAARHFREILVESVCRNLNVHCETYRKANVLFEVNPERDVKAAVNILHNKVTGFLLPQIRHLSARAMSHLPTVPAVTATKLTMRLYVNNKLMDTVSENRDEVTTRDNYGVLPDEAEAKIENPQKNWTNLKKDLIQNEMIAEYRSQELRSISALRVVSLVILYCVENAGDKEYSMKRSHNSRKKASGTVSVETVPDDAMMGYKDVFAVDLAKEWLNDSLLRLVSVRGESQNICGIPISLTAAECIQFLLSESYTVRQQCFSALHAIRKFSLECLKQTEIAYEGNIDMLLTVKYRLVKLLNDSTCSSSKHIFSGNDHWVKSIRTVLLEASKICKGLNNRYFDCRSHNLTSLNVTGTTLFCECCPKSNGMIQICPCARNRTLNLILKAWGLLIMKIMDCEIQAGDSVSLIEKANLSILRAFISSRGFLSISFQDFSSDFIFYPLLALLGEMIAATPTIKLLYIAFFVLKELKHCVLPNPYAKEMSSSENSCTPTLTEKAYIVLFKRTFLLYLSYKLSVEIPNVDCSIAEIAGECTNAFVGNRSVLNAIRNPFIKVCCTWVLTICSCVGENANNAEFNDFLVDFIDRSLDEKMLENKDLTKILIDCLGHIANANLDTSRGRETSTSTLHTLVGIQKYLSNVSGLDCLDEYAKDLVDKVKSNHAVKRRITLLEKSKLPKLLSNHKIRLPSPTQVFEKSLSFKQSRFRLNHTFSGIADPLQMDCAVIAKRSVSNSMELWLIVSIKNNTATDICDLEVNLDILGALGVSHSLEHNDFDSNQHMCSHGEFGYTMQASLPAGGKIDFVKQCFVVSGEKNTNSMKPFEQTTHYGNSHTSEETPNIASANDEATAAFFLKQEFRDAVDFLPRGISLSMILSQKSPKTNIQGAFDDVATDIEFEPWWLPDTLFLSPIASFKEEIIPEYSDEKYDFNEEIYSHDESNIISFAAFQSIWNLLSNRYFAKAVTCENGGSISTTLFEACRYISKVKHNPNSKAFKFAAESLGGHYLCFTVKECIEQEESVLNFEFRTSSKDLWSLLDQYNAAGDEDVELLPFSFKKWFSNLFDHKFELLWNDSLDCV